MCKLWKEYKKYLKQMNVTMDKIVFFVSIVLNLDLIGELLE